MGDRKCRRSGVSGCTLGTMSLVPGRCLWVRGFSDCETRIRPIFDMGIVLLIV